MSDRYNYLTVVLEKEMRDDDAEALISAIRQLRGVLSVKPNVATPEEYLAIARAKADITKRIWELLSE